MKHAKAFTLAMILALILSGLPSFTGDSRVAASGTFTRLIASGGTTAFRPSSEGTGELQWPEFVGEPDGGDAADAAQAINNPDGFINRSQSNGNTGNGLSVNSGKKAKSNTLLNVSFDGLNHRQQRLANGGNQFSLEPPDQGLCANSAYVMEAVNDVVRVYNTSGAALTGVVDLNTFYGYPAAINRTTGARGPFITDPSCYYDTNLQRWYLVVLTLDVAPTTGAFLGPNHLDIAVSTTANPTDPWTIYRIPVQDNGTAGTPNHNCDGGPCLGDYPHIGADQYGFYITTNEYPFFGDGFHGAQIYAFSKSALASGAASIAVTQFDTAGAVGGNPGFTVWPAQTPGTGYETGMNGTEYLLSSIAAEEANGTGSASQIVLWAITNTRSLTTASPALALSNTMIDTNTYSIPPKANQKSGDFPLGECINDTTMSTPFGPGCWQFLFVSEPAHNEVISHLDSNDTRMQQVMYANGKVWGALDTAATVNGENKAGIAWYVVKPAVSPAGVSGKLAMQGTLALAGNNLTYPAIGITSSGRGVMAFTLVGDDNYPSAGYAPIDAVVGVGDVATAAAGLGVADGFTSYKAEVGNPPRTRWGDYGAAAVVGNSVWIASEYIAQTCTLAQYATTPFGSCSGTRTSLANWGTRISKVTP